MVGELCANEVSEEQGKSNPPLAFSAQRGNSTEEDSSHQLDAPLS